MPPVREGRVVMFGAGGPVGASAAQFLKEHYTLRLTDVRPIAEIAAESKPQSPGAPLPVELPSPHECRVVDVTHYEQVLEACRGMDAIINVTVLRHQLTPAFRVNLAGAYNVARAAVELGIRRIIHTGPYHTTLNHNADYWWDFAVPDDVPLHPGGDIYALSKFLGGEVTRVFAERHALEVYTFLYCHFMPADGGDRPDGSGCYPFVTSWEDCGEAFLYGLRAPAPPRPYEPLFICADLPHAKYATEKAERLLGWRARHRFERLWSRPVSGEW
jgi:nucleoside-diphosphate-sugar epimerase